MSVITNTILLALLVMMISLILVASSQEDESCVDNGTCENCVNLHDNCVLWASTNECDKNPAYMNKHCRPACGLCEPPLVDDDNCRDLNPLCSEWAGTGECLLNPGYMNNGCRESCAQCINVTKLREEGKTESEIRQRMRYVKENRGVVQNIGPAHESAKVKPVLQEMEKYAIHNVTKFPLAIRRQCVNRHQDCAYLAAGKSCDTNVVWMMKQCPLACLSCESLSLFAKCKDTRPPDSKPLVEPGGIFETYQALLKSGMTLASVGKNVQDQDDPWVLQMDQFLTSTQVDALAKWMEGLDWKTAVPSNHKIRRLGNVAYCQDAKCLNDKTYTTLVNKISRLLSAPPAYMEPLEWVHYKYMESYGVHHDVGTKDLYLPAGPRVWSVFVCLSDVPKGGSMGFPELDWLSIPPRKGQVLVWPNVKTSAPSEAHGSMVSEGLPVLAEQGSKYGVHAWVRLYDYKAALDLGCVE